MLPQSVSYVIKIEILKTVVNVNFFAQLIYSLTRMCFLTILRKGLINLHILLKFELKSLWRDGVQVVLFGYLGTALFFIKCKLNKFLIYTQNITAYQIVLRSGHSFGLQGTAQMLDARQTDIIFKTNFLNSEYLKTNNSAKYSTYVFYPSLHYISEKVKENK